MAYSVQSIVDLFGGAQALAEAIGRDPASIYRWQYPKSRGGTGGRIPKSAIKSIVQAAQARGIPLHEGDLNDCPGDPEQSQFVHWLRSTAPYIHAHRGRTFVIAFPGEAVASPRFPELIHDFALLNSLGIRLVLIHGIRPQVEQRLKQRRHRSTVHQQMRVTDRETLQVVKEAAGAVRVEIEALLSLGLANSPMAEARLQVASGNLVTAKPLGIIDGVDHLHTGVVRRIDRDAIQTLLNAGHLVLVSPLGFSPTGEVFNLRAEEIATAIATAIQADKLLLLSEDPALQERPGDLIRQLTTMEAEQRLSELTESDTAQHLHLEEAIRASRSGVQRVHLLDHRQPGSLLLELFTRQGTGTLISASAFQEVRPARVQDISGIMDLITPLQERGILAPRSSESILQDLDKFYVIDQDGMITTCAALYSFPDHGMGELACVAVHPDYRTGKRGDHLLNTIEQKARRLGLHHIFVLTTQSSHWFQEKGFRAATVDELPKARQLNYNNQRRSRVLIKAIDS